MIRSFLIAVLAAAWLTGCGQGQSQAEKQAITDTINAYQEAYNQHNASQLANLWASDGIYFNPLTGERAEGRTAIEKFYQDKFSEGKQGRVEIHGTNIRFPEPNVAIQTGTVKMMMSDQPVQYFAYQVTLVKESGKWLFDVINEIEVQEAPSHFEQLKELAWLVGKWQDVDENVNIVFDNQWDKYKNFLTQNFVMSVYGQENIEGKQIIAWDPERNVIRSWVFDSDGGFGEGTWEKEGDKWYATMRYVLSDGRVASSINIYTPVNEHSYTFASVEREVGGEILPNMDPVTVEKIK